MIPFFVADRPMSLKILKGLNLKDYPGVKIGIMAHANTSDNFQKAFRDYPCEDLKRCDAIGAKPCLYKTDRGRSNCKHRQLILDRTVKMCDSGVFTKEGAMLSYDELFAAYSRMNVDYGIMIDVLHDAPATVESALEAKKAYEPYQDKFKLVVVAQGKAEEEYLDCYDKLKLHGFENIAIGGLLRRNQNTVRYVKVGSNELLFNILERVKAKYSPDWLFALGCLNPNRIERLKQLNVWADYKGWIFKYKKRNQSLNILLEEFEKNYCNLPNYLEISKVIEIIKKTINQRNTFVFTHKKILKDVNQGKKEIRKKLKETLDVLSSGEYISKSFFYKIANRSFFSNQERQIIIETFKELKQEKSSRKKNILEQAEKNHKLNKNKKEIENNINKCNQKLLEQFQEYIQKSIKVAKEDRQLCNRIIELLEISDHNYRLEQVRNYIEQKILKLLN